MKYSHKILKGFLVATLAVLLVWCLWAFIPYLRYLIVGSDSDLALRNMRAGYELPMFILLISVLVLQIAALWWGIKSYKRESAVFSGYTFPWYTAAATNEQRSSFEEDLRRLCAACTKGQKGATKPLTDWLLEQQKSGIILLPDNYSLIYQELSDHYGFGLSKQAFSAAMP